MPFENEDKIPYGLLNPVDTMYGPNKDIYNTDNQPFSKTLSDVAKDRYSRDILAGAGEYTAICLAVANPLIAKDFTKQMLYIFALPTQENSQQRIYARIPEIHSHLPIPKDENDLDVIRMYPLFVGSTELTPPKSGELIQVSFKNVYNQQGPIYLGPTYNGNKANSQGGQSLTIANNVGQVLQSGSGSVYVQQALMPTDPNYKSKLEEAMKNVYRPYGKESKNGSKYNLSIQPRPIKFFELPRDRNILNSIIIHESVDDSLESTERALLGKPPGLGVHFTVTQDGSIYSYNDPKNQVIHLPIMNTRSIGVEIVNRYLGYNKKESDKRDTVNGKWVIHSGSDKNAQQIYIVPTRKQLESAFKLIKNLCINYQIPIAFPSVNNGYFIWGQSPGILKSAGISSHQHVGGHADGTYIEYYVLCRFNDKSPEEAYTIALRDSKTIVRSQKTKIQ